MHYTLSFQNPLSGWLHIKLEIEVQQQPEIFLHLPAWRPGRYELQHFAQNIGHFSAKNELGETLEVEKTTKDRWQIHSQNSHKLYVNYSYYARQMDAGGSWLDDQQLYVNPVNCLLFAEGLEQQEHTLQLELPELWRVACGLPSSETHIFTAKNYDQLADSPFIASPNLKHQQFEQENIQFHIWVQGECEPGWQQIISDFKAYTTEQLKVFKGEFPEPEYHYFFQILPYRHYHGVEHYNSTVITLGPSELLMQPSLYKELLGISSHELFHTWNMKKIRPAELLPYNFKAENYFRTGYVAEGITTYYGDYMLARSRVFNWQQYQQELNQYLQRHFQDEGEAAISVADSSFDLWLDGYKAGVPRRKSSIYQKGALAALILDLELRKITEDKASLDDVMQQLWKRFGKTEKGYTEADYQQIVKQLANSSFQKYFDEIIFGIQDLAEALNQALKHVGCTLKIEENPILHESVYGFKLITKEQQLLVSAIATNSPAENKLMLNDEIIAVDRFKATQTRLHHHNLYEPCELILFRNHHLQTVQLKPTQKRFFKQYKVEKLAEATEEQKNNYQLWLKQSF